MVGLHEFFVDWFNDVVDDTDAEFSRVADVLHPRFSMVLPSGETLDRATVLEQIRRAHATAATTPARIEIRNLVDRVVSDDGALITYEEWQFAGDQLQNVRASTAYFVQSPAAPNGVAWLHLHETLITSD